MVPTWAPSADPCAVLDGLVFQKHCGRFGFLNGRYWTFYLNMYEGGGEERTGRYTCAQVGSDARVLQCNSTAAPMVFDPSTGALGSYDLVGDDLGSDFARWFPELLEEFQALGTTEPPGDTGCR